MGKSPDNYQFSIIPDSFRINRRPIPELNSEGYNPGDLSADGSIHAIDQKAVRALFEGGNVKINNKAGKLEDYLRSPGLRQIRLIEER